MPILKITSHGSPPTAGPRRSCPCSYFSGSGESWPVCKHWEWPSPSSEEVLCCSPWCLRAFQRLSLPLALRGHSDHVPSQRKTLRGLPRSLGVKAEVLTVKPSMLWPVPSLSSSPATLNLIYHLPAVPLCACLRLTPICTCPLLGRSSPRVHCL